MKLKTQDLLLSTEIYNKLTPKQFTSNQMEGTIYYYQLRFAISLPVLDYQYDILSEQIWAFGL